LSDEELIKPLDCSDLLIRKDDKFSITIKKFYKKDLPRRFGGEICGWVSKYREINFPSQY